MDSVRLKESHQFRSDTNYLLLRNYNEYFSSLSISIVEFFYPPLISFLYVLMIDFSFRNGAKVSPKSIQLAISAP